MATEPETETQTQDEQVDPIVKQMTNMTELINTLTSTNKSLTNEMKTLMKEVNKLRIAASKPTKRVKKPVDPNTPRKLGALEKPIEITEELCDFLKLEKGELYSRQFITKSINEYVKSNDIQNPENRRYILLESSDAGLKLKKLLRDPDQPLTFFNIQRYLKVHYPKSEDTAADKKIVDLSDDKTDKTEKADKADKADKAEKAVKADKADKAEKADKTDKTDKTDKADDVVADAATVDETPAEEPKKKVVRKVVKKTTA